MAKHDFPGCLLSHYSLTLSADSAVSGSSGFALAVHLEMSFNP